MDVFKRYITKLSILSKKILVFSMAIYIGFTTFGFNYILPVFAGEPGPEVVLTGGVANEDYIEFYADENLMGKLLVKIGDEILSPVGNKIELPEYTGEPYQVGFYMTYGEGYVIEDINVYKNGELFETYLMPGDLTFYVSILSDDDLSISFNFKESDDLPEPGNPAEIFPILAYFSDVVDPVEMNFDGNILVPSGWTSGTVSFKAKICQIDSVIVPDDGINICDADTETLSDLNIQGISNRDQINRTVSGSEDGEYIIIDDEFNNYGKVGIHLVNDDINVTTDVISENLINIEAIAPMRMHYSYGLSTLDQTILTNESTGNVSIFFGNNEVNLKASGPNVIGIVQLSGADYVLEEDGSVTITLPLLSEETTTSVTLTIALSDDGTVTKQVNVMRTAIELSFDGESKTLNAGYVIHKAYLYNNQPHDDETFNAYLQVILYKDDVVVGYKQVKIDDEEIVNNLGEDESISIESIGSEPIVLYEDENGGVNKASVFLTNGPIDYNSDILPSIEFGLGAGVQLEWGE